MQKPVAAFLLGCFLLVGPARAGFDEGLAAYNEGRFQAAIDEFIPLAEEGDAWARFYLGHILYFGYGREADPNGAANLYSEAAEQGHALAQYSLGRVIFNGEGVTRDVERGAHWMRRAAQQGLGEAQFNLALLHRVGDGAPYDLGEAHFWCTLAAESVAGQEDDELSALLGPPCAEIALRLDPKARFKAEERSWLWQPQLENPAIWPTRATP
jgi:uncharacterized protein